jgi:hypothetical protein
MDFMQLAIAKRRTHRFFLSELSIRVRSTHIKTYRITKGKCTWYYRRDHKAKKCLCRKLKERDNRTVLLVALVDVGIDVHPRALGKVEHTWRCIASQKGHAHDSKRLYHERH